MIDSSVSSGPTAILVIIAVLLVPSEAAAVWDVLKDAAGPGGGGGGGGYHSDGLSPLERGEHPPQSALVMQLKLPQCRDDCMEKFNAVDDLRCLQNADCSHCVGRCTTPLVAGDDENRIPDAPSPLARPPSSSVQPRQRIGGPGMPGMPAESIRLRIESLIRDRALVSADIRWRWPRAWMPRLGGHCLVTWDVAGGGLMGNLLTDVPEAELTLWPQTVYHIQVTCKCKENGQMFKALPLTIDTSKAIDILDLPSTTTATTTTITQTTLPARSTPQPSPSTTRSNLIPRKSYEPTYKLQKDTKKHQVLQLLEQQQYDLSVQSNEILPPHHQHRTSALAQNPAQSSTSRTQLPVGRSSRLRLEILLGLCLAGTGSLAVYWVFLSGRYAAAHVVSLSPVASGKREPKLAKSLVTEKEGHSVWLATSAEESIAGRKTEVGGEGGGGSGGPEVPLMRVMHV